jgi:hypothetical protein
MGGRQQLARRLLAQDVFAAVALQQEGGVALAALELADLEFTGESAGFPAEEVQQCLPVEFVTGADVGQHG